MRPSSRSPCRCSASATCAPARVARSTERAVCSDGGSAPTRTTVGAMGAWPAKSRTSSQPRGQRDDAHAEPSGMTRPPGRWPSAARLAREAGRAPRRHHRRRRCRRGAAPPGRRARRARAHARATERGEQVLDGRDGRAARRAQRVVLSRVPSTLSTDAEIGGASPRSKEQHALVRGRWPQTHVGRAAAVQPNARNWVCRRRQRVRPAAQAAGEARRRGETSWTLCVHSSTRIFHGGRREDDKLPCARRLARPNPTASSAVRTSSPSWRSAWSMWRTFIP